MKTQTEVDQAITLARRHAHNISIYTSRMHLTMTTATS